MAITGPAQRTRVHHRRDRPPETAMSAPMSAGRTPGTQPSRMIVAQSGHQGWMSQVSAVVNRKPDSWQPGRTRP